MIGSPWNPFFDQTIPGTLPRYNGRLADSADNLQFGCFNLLRVPQYLTIKDRTAPGGEPIVLTRDYSLWNQSPQYAELLAAAWGELYATQLMADILKTGFLWWYKPQDTWGGALPRVLWKSQAVGDYAGKPLFWFLGIGIKHRQFAQDDRVRARYGNQFYTWSLWCSTGVPDESNPGVEAEIWSSTEITQGLETFVIEYYPLYMRQATVNNDIPAGSRIQSPIDLNQPSPMVNMVNNFPPLVLLPWYRGAR